MSVTRMDNIFPMLWFDGRAEEAAKFYVDVFQDGKISAVTHWPEGSRGPAGEVLTVAFEIRGKNFLALNGGPEFKFNEAVSFVANCPNQAEIDRLWSALSADGGATNVCGWLKDKFGVSWQIVPESIWKMMHDSDETKGQRVMKAVWEMEKLDLAVLERAYRGD